MSTLFIRISTLDDQIVEGTTSSSGLGGGSMLNGLFGGSCFKYCGHEDIGYAAKVRLCQPTQHPWSSVFSQLEICSIQSVPAQSHWQ